MRRGSAEHSTGLLTCRFAIIPLWRHRAVRPSVRTGNGPPPSATRSACPWPDSNGRPSAPEADALSTLSYTGSGPDDTELTTRAVDSGSPRPWRADSLEHMFRTSCSFDGCTSKHRARGLCSSHLDQLARGKELTPLLGPHGRKHERCTFPDCARRHHAGGLCTGHATQRQRGRPLRRGSRPLRRGSRCITATTSSTTTAQRTCSSGTPTSRRGPASRTPSGGPVGSWRNTERSSPNENLIGADEDPEGPW